MIPSATNLSTLSLKSIRLRKPAFGRTLALASSNSARPASGVIAPTDADARSPASESARSIVLPAHEDTATVASNILACRRVKRRAPETSLLAWAWVQFSGLLNGSTPAAGEWAMLRSEEHTSELQSLLRT